jgi:hypothetical protein
LERRRVSTRAVRDQKYFSFPQYFRTLVDVTIGNPMMAVGCSKVPRNTLTSTASVLDTIGPRYFRFPVAALRGREARKGDASMSACLCAGKVRGKQEAK